MAYSFNPEAFITPATSPEEWSRQQTSSIIGAGEAFAQGQARKEQTRQFEAEQNRLKTHEGNRHLEQMLELDLRDRGLALQEREYGLNEQKYAFEQDKYAFEQEQEGVAVIQKALLEADTVDEMNAIAESAAKEYGIVLEFGADAPAQMGSTVPPPPGAVDTPRPAQAAPKTGSSLPSAPPPADVLPIAPRPEPGDIEKRLSEMTPVQALESESRTRTDAGVQASYQKRVAQLQQMAPQMGLTPEQVLMAQNLAAGAHGIPPAPMPPPVPTDVQEPNTPAGAEAEPVEVTLPPQLVQAMTAPPELEPDLVRDTIAAGWFRMRSTRTGRDLGRMDWNQVQESRREKRRREAMPLLDLSEDPTMRRRLKAAIDSYIENGSKEGYDLLKAFMVNQARQQSAQQSAVSTAEAIEGRRGKESLESLKMRVDAKEAIVKSFEETYSIKDMRDKIMKAEKAISDLANMSPDGRRNAIEERGMITDYIRTAVGTRSTDKDVDLALGKGFFPALDELAKRFTDDGAVSDERLREIGEYMAKLSAYEKSRSDRLKDTLRAIVGRDEVLQTLAPDNIENVANELVGRVFLDPGVGRVRHRVDPTITRRREARDSASISSSATNSSSSTNTKPVVTVTDDDADEARSLISDDEEKKEGQ